MKTIKGIFLITMFLVVAISCNELKEKKDNSKIEISKEMPVELTSVEIEIEGMTCEIGCARLIQSKLIKIDGVKFVKVSFEEKNGKITFDSNKLNKNSIKEIVENIAGGELYKVVKINEVQEFSKTSAEVNI